MKKTNRSPSGRSESSTKRAFIYDDYKDNHVIWPGQENELKKFVTKTYGGQQHKLKNAYSSNSEDALTWSCFHTLRHVSDRARRQALADIWKLAFAGEKVPAGVDTGKIEMGETFGREERTEVDISIEGPGVLIFIEAKLYSPMSQADPSKGKPHNQIARKLRVGARVAAESDREFYFILLDIAPIAALSAINPGATLSDALETKAAGFGSKWLTSYWFSRYKSARRGSITPLSDVLKESPPIAGISASDLAKNMGWLTWADVFKAVLRAVISDLAS